MIDLDKLQHFVCVAQNGSFVAASRDLQLSQPALSRSIQALERHLHVRLLDRDRTGVRLTVAGATLLPRAIDLLANSENIRETLLAQASGTAGDVRFGIGPFIGSAVLPVALREYALSTSAVQVRASLGSVETMTHQLVHDEIEFFLGLDAPVLHEPPFEVGIVTHIGPRFFARSSHPLAMKKVSLDELGQYRIASGSAFRHILGRTSWPHATSPAIEIDNPQILADIVRETDAVLVAAVGATPHDLVELDVDLAESLASKVALVTVSRRTLSPAAAVLAARLVETVQSLALGQRDRWRET